MFLLYAIAIYFCICAVLIVWPAPQKSDGENYDYSTLSESGKNIISGEEHWVTLRDGTQLFSRVYNSDSSCDSTLVLLHGSGTDSRYLSQIAAYLSDTGLCRVVTPDLRGHGRNKGRRGDIDYIGQLDHDVEDLFTDISNKFGGTKILLGGHSSGGGMALRYVGNKQVRQPDGLLLFAPYLGHDAPTVKPNSGGWVTVVLKRWIGLSMLNRFGIRLFNDLKVLIFNRPEEWNDELQVPSYSYRMAVNYGPSHYVDDIKKIAVPTLVLVGSSDESFHPEKFASVFGVEKPAPLIDVKIVKGANHMSIVDDSDSRRFILDWYQSTTDSRIEVSAD